MYDESTRLYYLVLPMAVFYMLLLVRPISLMFLRLFGDTDRHGKDLPSFPKKFQVPGSEFVLASMTLDLVEIVNTWRYFPYYWNHSGNDLVYLILPVLLFLIHLQFFIFTKIYEYRFMNVDKPLLYRSRARILSILFGVSAIFTNAVTVAALLHPRGF